MWFEPMMRQLKLVGGVLQLFSVTRVRYYQSDEGKKFVLSTVVKCDR